MPNSVAAFVDESFHGFFDLSDDNGYFCMGILLVPLDCLWEFNNLFIGYRRALSSALGMHDDGDLSNELKSTKLRRLSKAKRLEYLIHFLTWARQNKVVVGGFFTSTIGYINYNTRNDRAATQAGVVSDFLEQESIRATQADIQSRRASAPAESMMIGDIAQAIAGMLLHYCGERDMSFTLHYDPRSETEDKEVFRRIEELLPALELSVIGRKGVYQGCANNLPSNKSCGLQMADFLTRDLRALFKYFPALLTENVSTNLITRDPGDPSKTISTRINGRVFKWGEVVEIPESLIRAIFSEKLNFTFADYLPIMMTGRVSTYSATGEARLVNFLEERFEVMVD